MPSKALIRSAKLAHQMQHAKRYGLDSGLCKADEGYRLFSFKEITQRIQAVIAAIEPHDSIERYTALGVEVLQGYAKIINPWTVEITLNADHAPPRVVRLTTRSIVIAAGAGRLCRRCRVWTRWAMSRATPYGSVLHSLTKFPSAWWCWAVDLLGASWRKALRV